MGSAAVASAGEGKTEQLRGLVERGERLRFDDHIVRQRMATFDDLWATMTIKQQAPLLRHLIERVGDDARGGKVKVPPQARQSVPSWPPRRLWPAPGARIRSRRRAALVRRCPDERGAQCSACYQADLVI